MKKINIKYMNDDVLETIKSNPNKYTQIIIDHSESKDWILQEFKQPYTVKKITIPDFEFKIDKNMENKELSFVNSVILHQSLKDLPPYIFSDERFWAWINFDKGYYLCNHLMPLKMDSSRLKNHYFFGSGSIRRGMFFGVISRLFFRALLTYDPTNADPYELTKYVNDNPQRFRNLSWRTYSNNAELVRKILKIQYKLEFLYKDKINNKIYEEIAKYLSQIGSLTYVELLNEQDLESMITKKVLKIIDESKLPV